MVKKISKTLSFLALIILSLGAIFFVPSFFKQTKTSANEKELEVIDFASSSIETDVYHFGKQCMILDSAEDLARVSYEVSQGNQDFVNGYFYLNADINLQSGLWVPIGTATYPFNGYFFGNGHKVSNIMIAKASQIAGSDVGLFGNVTGSICDLTVDGTFMLSQLVDTNVVKVGNIVGSLEGEGEVLNCYDEVLKSDIVDSYNSIGNATSTSKVVYGGSKNGLTSLYSTKEEIDKTITYSGSPVVGYTAFFNTNVEIDNKDEGEGVGFYSQGKFVYSATNGDEEVVNQLESQQIRVAYNNSDFSDSVLQTIKNPLYFKNVPVLRENASSDNVYILRSGYRATVGQPVIADSGIVNVDWEVKTINISYNYGYGNTSEYGTRTYSFTVGYDTPWKTVIANKPIVRLGYNGTTELFSDSAKMVALNQTDKSQYSTYYPAEGSTVYMNWNSAKTDINGKIYFAASQEEGGAFTNVNASDAISNLNIQGATVVANDFSNLVAGNAITITFTLNSGYTFQGAGVGQNLLSKYEWDQNNITSLSNGAYTYYPNQTNTGDSYTAGTGGYYDTYLPIEITVSNSDDNYTITIENILDKGGEIALIFGREQKTISFTGENLDYIKVANISENSPQTTFNWTAKTVTTKIGEKFNLTFSTETDTEISDYYILEHNVTGFTAVVSETNETEINGVKFYKEKSFAISSFMPEANEDGQEEKYEIELNINRLLTYIVVQIGENGNFYENIPANQQNKATISASGIASQETKGKITVQVPMTVDTTITFENNGFFHLKNADIKSTLEGDSTLNPINNAITKRFAQFSNNPDVPAYIVTLNPEKKSYNVTINYTIDGQAVDQDIIDKYLTFDGVISDLDFGATDPYLYTLTLTEQGKIWLDYNFEIVGENLGNSNTGYQAAEIVGAVNGKLSSSFGENGINQFQFKAGTFDSKITINLARKNIVVKFENAKLNNDKHDVVETLLYNTINIKYSINGDGSLGVTNGSLTSITIENGYYLVAWYLSNGAIVNVFSAEEIIKNGDFMNLVASSASGNKSSVEISISPLVEKRTIQLEYHATEDEGLSSDDGITAPIYSYKDSEVSLSTEKYKKIGYTFANWTTENGTISNGKYSLTGTAWNIYWEGSSTSSTHTWTNFAVAEEKQKIVVLEAQFEEVVYKVAIDSQGTIDLIIGQTITFTPSVNKDYATYKNQETLAELNGNVVAGYSVTSFAIQGNIVPVVSQQGLNTFTLTLDNIKKFIAETDYYTTNENAVLTISTVRTVNEYKIYIKDNQYYQITFKGNEEQGGTDENGTYVFVTYEQKPTNLSFITVDRNGYTPAGYENFNTEENYTTVGNTTITPRFERNLLSNYVKDKITVTETETFKKENQVTTNQYEFYIDWLGFKNGEYESLITTNFATEIYDNGDQAVSAQFIAGVDAIDNSTALTFEDVYNIFKLRKNYNFEFDYVVTIKDTLTNNTYTISYDINSFAFIKNEIAFNDTALKSYYTGTSDFVIAPNSSYGTVLDLRYKADGTEYLPEEDGDIFQNAVENSTITIIDSKSKYVLGNYDASILFGKASLNLTDEEYGLINYVYSNLTTSDAGANVTVTNAVEVVVTPAIVTFESSIGMYVENMVQIIAQNVSNQTFNVANNPKYQFAYSFSKLTLKNNNEGIYTGKENHEEDALIFNIDDFVVMKGMENVTSNFEWVISTSSTYQVVPDFNSTNYSYSSKYFTAQKGSLTSMSDFWEESRRNTFSISNLIVDDKSIQPNNNGEFSTQYNYLIGKQILFTIIGNNTNNLIIKFNNDLIGDHEVTFNITVSEKLAESLVLFNWQNGTNIDTDLFGNVNASRTIAFSNKTTLQGESYAVFTDASQVVVDYNNAYSSTASEIETLYVSTSGGELTIADKTDSLNEVIFAGFELTGSGVSATDNDGNYTITNETSGSKTTLKAKWNLSQEKIEAKVNQLKTTYSNSPLFGDEVIDINKILTLSIERAQISLPPVVVFEENSPVSVKAINGSNYGIVLELDQTLGYIKMENAGDYTITFTIRYSDGIQSLQKIAISRTFTLNMVKNVFEIKDSTALNDLTFANKDLASEIKIASSVSYYSNDTLVADEQTITIGGSGLPASNVFYNDDVITTPELNNSTNPLYLQVTTPESQKDFYYAGDYSIVVGMFSDFSSYFTLQGQTSLSINIEKDTIRLADYNDKISVGKLVGTLDPNPIVDDITIIENNNDIVTIEFTRTGDDSLGEHDLFYKSISDEDKKNYIVDAAGFNAKFVIAENTEGVVSVSIPNGIHSTYNGKTINSFDLVYQDGKFLLKAYSDGQEIASKEISVKLMVEGNEYEIADTSKGLVAGLIEVNFKDKDTVGAKDYIKSGYALNITLNSSEEFKDIVTTNSDDTLYIDKANLTITSITKEFDRTNTFENNNVEFTGVVEDETLSISGTFASEKAGSQTIEDIEISGTTSNNYQIVNPDFVGTITKKTVESVSATSTNNQFVYGSISQITTLDGIKDLLGNIIITLDGFDDVIEKGYATISNFEIENASYSTTSKNLVVKTYTLNLIITSSDYQISNNKAAISIEITKFELDLSSTIISKAYDGGYTLPSQVDWKGLDRVFLGDNVSVDEEATLYKENIRKNGIVITVVLKGTDSANYSVKNNVVGNITALQIKLNIELTENHPVWPDDNQNIVLGNNTVTINYPFDDGQNAQSILNAMQKPSRVGYDFTGYSIKTTEGMFELLDADKLSSLLESIAVDVGNTEKTGTIYPNWKIQKFTVTITGNNLASIESVSDTLIGSNGNYTIEYYQDMYFSVKTENGYKISQFEISGNYTSKTEGDKGTNLCQLNISKVLGNLTINVVSQSVSVTINIDKNIPTVDGVEIIETSSAWSTKEFIYADLTNEKLVEQLPNITVTDYTFVLNGFTGDGTVDLSSEETLKEFIDNIYNTLDTDKIINLTAQWIGETYTIKFDANGGTFVEESDASYTFTVEFGKEITLSDRDDFPVVEKEGMIYSYQDALEGGKTYTVGSIFTTISASKEVTLYAIWSDGEFGVEFIIDDHIKVTIDGIEIKKGEKKNILYSEEFEISVEADEGYSFEAKTNATDGFYGLPNANTTSSPFTISKVFANSTLKFVAVPNDNTLTLSYNEKQVASVMVDDSPYDVEAKPKIQTGNQSTIVLNAKTGYEFVSANIASGNGSLDVTLEKNNTSMTIVWSDFTKDTTINIVSKPKEVSLTWQNLSDYISELYINNNSQSINGGTITVTVDSLVSIQITALYGYNISLYLDEDYKPFEIENPESVLNNNKVYVYTATIKNFVSDFDISLSVVERTWTVSASVEDYGDEERGTVEVRPSGENNLEFNSSVTLTATPTSNLYRFMGWYLNGEFKSDLAQYRIEATNENKNLLESGNLNYVAKFDYNTVDLTFTAGVNGKMIITVNDQVENNVIVEAGSPYKATLFVNDKVVITLQPNTGYELDKFMLDEDNMSTSIIDNQYTFVVTATGYKNVNVTFKASIVYIDVSITVQVSTTNFDLSTDGGLLYWANEDGTPVKENSEDNEIYLKPSQGTLTIGVNYQILTYTDQYFYLVAETNPGYKFSINVTKEPATISEVLSTDGLKTLYKISGITNENGIPALQGLFKAEEQQVEIKFATSEDAQTNELAGKINVVSGSAPYSISGNNSERTIITTVTGAEVELNIATSFNFQLTSNNGKLKVFIRNSAEGFVYEVGNITAQSSDKILETGFTYTSTLKLSNINANMEILIIVEPFKYNVEFYVDAQDEEVYGSRVVLKDVVYGQPLNLDSLSSEDKARLMKNVNNYTLHGYFTKQLGQGNQYLDEQLNAVGPWLESGYIYNGSSYKVADNYNDETNTFTLYASWSYDKAIISIDFIPPQLENLKDNVNIADIITNINQTIYWISAADAWYGEFSVDGGLVLELQALTFEGYEFGYWKVVNKQTQAEYTYTSQSVSLSDFEKGNYSITNVYYPKFTLNITCEDSYDLAMCGTSYLMQDGVVVKGNSFDSQKPLTLVAEENLGYAFQYWMIKNNSEPCYGTRQEDGKITFELGYRTEPIDIEAIFEGDKVGLKFDTTNYQHGTITQLYVNGNMVEDFDREVEIKVGNKIEIVVENDNGYGIAFEDVLFNLDPETNRYVYIVKAQDLKEESSLYDGVIIVKPISTQKEISFYFQLKVEGKSQLDEINLTGTRRFVYTVNNQIQANTLIGEGSLVDGLLFGGVASISIVPGVNFAIKSIVIKNANGIEQDITKLINGGNVNISIEILTNLFVDEKPYTIVIDFEKMVWSGDKYRSNELSGSGTTKDPYIIKDAKDMGFVAWAVNTNQYNKNDISYADCSYKVTSDIDFFGKYWEPIGTKENPFNGVMDLGKYAISNVSFYGEYTNPNPSYNGLFWIVSDDAIIIQTNNVLTIALGIGISVAILAIIVIIIFAIVRKNKKKKYNDLLNA